MTAQLTSSRRIQRTHAFTFEQTLDQDLIKAIITHESLWKHVTDDYSPSRLEYNPVMHEAVLYLIVRDQANDNELQGLFFFHPINTIQFEVHTCLLPHCWGSAARQIARDMLTWLWSNTSCQRLVTTVPDYNRLALVFAKAAGMVEYGRNPESYMKGGKLIDLILLGIGRPKDLNPCQ